MKLITDGTQEEKETLVKAICLEYNYSDTKTVRTTEIVTDDDGNKTEKYTDTIVSVKPDDFAMEKIQNFLDRIVIKYNTKIAENKRAEALAEIDKGIQEEVNKNKINFQ